jgi:hypothetical protein
LWAVIERAQSKLEGEGLSTDIVDAAITRGLEILLLKQSRERPGRRSVRSLWVPVHGAALEA